MLRRHSVEGASIVDVAVKFGVSRPTVYQAQAAFQQAGLSGLLPPRPQGKAQAVCRSPRLCAGFAGCRAGLDDRRLCRSRSGEVWDHDSPPESGAGDREQKTAQSSVSRIPEGAVEAYEELRRQAVEPDGREEHFEGRGVLMRRGLARGHNSGPPLFRYVHPNRILHPSPIRQPLTRLDPNSSVC